MQNYWSSSYDISKVVGNNINKVRRQIPWGELSVKIKVARKMHLLKWDKVCSSKELGGLRLANIRAKNLVFLSIWWWKLSKEERN